MAENHHSWGFPQFTPGEGVDHHHSFPPPHPPPPFSFGGGPSGHHAQTPFTSGPWFGHPGMNPWTDHIPHHHRAHRSGRGGFHHGRRPRPEQANNNNTTVNNNDEDMSSPDTVRENEGPSNPNPDHRHGRFGGGRHRGYGGRCRGRGGFGRRRGGHRGHFPFHPFAFQSMFGGGAPFPPPPHHHHRGGAWTPDSDSENEDDEEYGTFSPPIDIFTTPSTYVLHVALPGAKKEDIGVHWDVDSSTLSIAGVVHRPGDEAFLQGLASSERRVGMFERDVVLPPAGCEKDGEVDGEGITAKMEDGLLIVTVPKTEKEWQEIHKVDIE